MSGIATPLVGLERTAQIAFAALVIASYKGVLPDPELVSVRGERRDEVPEDAEAGLAHCRLELGGSVYVGTVWRNPNNHSHCFARLNQIINSSGKHYPMLSKFFKNMPHDYLAELKKRTG